ncbi:Uncharacterised protein [Kocuria rosea]|nr:hypothetical protein FHX38_2213 [Kocuria rosea]VEI49835.1 Uncharacterised protein [Kocuria rosea]
MGPTQGPGPRIPPVRPEQAPSAPDLNPPKGPAVNAQRPDALPSVEIVAVPFHRLRRNRWAMTFVPADGSCPVRRTFPAFRDAVVAARGLALAGRTPVSA